ncbi:MAG: hypothetical protein NTX25_06435 [Proteobacteria bacterium]|nr:hypothetical protein [Pseudomonadota bacterium]
MHFCESTLFKSPTKTTGLLLLQGILALWLTGCVHKKEASQPKFGFIPEYVRDGLLHVEPNKTIGICHTGGATQRAIDNLKLAVKQWAETLGRGAYLNITETCQQGPGDALINMGVSPSLEGCLEGAVGCTRLLGNRQYSMYFASTSHGESYDLILHETGHLWGNCDRYDFHNPTNEAFRSPNCYGFTNEVFNAPSAMQALGGNPVHSITGDDIDGMRAISQDTSIYANQVWNSFLAQQQSSSPIQAAPPSNGSCPDGSNGQGLGFGIIYQCGASNCAKSDKDGITECVIGASQAEYCPDGLNGPRRGYGSLYQCGESTCAKSDPQGFYQCVIRP